MYEGKIPLPSEPDRFIKPERAGIARADFQGKRHSFEWSRLVEKLEEAPADAAVAHFRNYEHLIHEQDVAAEFVAPIRDKQCITA